MRVQYSATRVPESTALIYPINQLVHGQAVAVLAGMLKDVKYILQKNGGRKGSGRRLRIISSSKSIT
jgi:hypothetical protein